MIGRFLFRSGNQEHPGDRIENTTVEILPFMVSRQHSDNIQMTVCNDVETEAGHLSDLVY